MGGGREGKKLYIVWESAAKQMYIPTDLKGNLVWSFSLSTCQKINQNKTLKKVHYEHPKILCLLCAIFLQEFLCNECPHFVLKGLLKGDSACLKHKQGSVHGRLKF